MCLNGLADTCDLVNADVVHDDYVATPESRSKDLFDISQEADTVHRPIQHQRGRDPIVAQRSNEGRSFPMAMWHLAHKPFAACSSTVAAGHVCRGTGFIDEHETFWIEPGLHLEPCLTRCGHVRPVLFCRAQAFF